MSFGAPLNSPAGPNPFSVAVGDFNGDGKPDLAVATADNSINGNGVGVLLSNGDGTFQSARRFAAGNVSRFVAVGDFNGDGKPDLATISVNCTGVGILLGNGDGTFQAAHNFAAGNGPFSVAVGDLNGDGKPDLAVSNDATGSPAVSVLLGNGDGSFQTAKSYGAGLTATSVAVGDFNGDGKPDLATANYSSGTVNVMVGNGDGSFQSAQTFAAGNSPVSVAVGDLNGDGKPDLATANPSSNTISVLLGNGDGTFQAVHNFAAGNGPFSVAVGDLNGDGKPDLAVSNDATGSPAVSVLLGNGDGSFEAAQSFRTESESVSVAVGDFNGDGKPDLVATEVDTKDVGVLLNQFVTTTTVVGPVSSPYGQSVTFTATVTGAATPGAGGSITFLDGNTPISGVIPLNANGQASFSIATLNGGSHAITASYSGTPGGAGTTGSGPSIGAAGLTIDPLPLSATAVNFGATAGAPFTGTVATLTNPDPYGTAASYTALIDWGDGTTSTGTITGTGTLTVTGSHTYADPAIDAVSVRISHNLGNTTTATVYPTADVTSLGQDVQHGLTGGIGFWQGKNGQALINSFNGGGSSTALSSWLAASFPNLYGIGNFANDLFRSSNAMVAAFYQRQFALSGSNLEAEVLATALNVYATTQSLGGSTGKAYGFTVSADGLGADSFNVGVDGAAFGVADNTTLNVYELLQAVNQQAEFAVPYSGDKTLRGEANDLFDALNKAGAIS